MAVAQCVAGLVLGLCAPILATYSGKVLLVSMDGFRWDYLNGLHLPNFEKLAKTGVKQTYMNNSFTTRTFPNHYTMVTGLFEETHGIVENHMYDPVFNATFTPANTESRWWDGGEPLWVTAKKQGKITGAYFWAGSEVSIRGVRPNFWLKYDVHVPFKSRVDTVMRWFTVRHADLVTLYFDEPDTTGHAHGPGSPEVRSKVIEMDNILGYIMDQLAKNALGNVNVIVTSDHGMTTIDTVRRVVDISDHVDMNKITMVPSQGPIMQILPVAGEEDAVFQALSGVDHMTVYHKNSIPNRFHYKHNRRIMPIVAIAEEGWLITTNKKWTASWKAKGDHGYDNQLMSMKPIFLARGPNFKENYTGNGMWNVDIYPLVCKLLNVTPSSNNGSLPRVADLTRESIDMTLSVG